MTKGRRWKHGSIKYTIKVCSTVLLASWWPGRGPVTTGGQWLGVPPPVETRARGQRPANTAPLNTLLGLYDQLCVSVGVLSMFMDSHSHYCYFLWPTVAHCGQLCCVLRCCPWLFFLFLLSSFPPLSHKQTNQSLVSDVAEPTGQHWNIMMQSWDMFWLDISWHWILTRILKPTYLLFIDTKC